MTAEPQWCVVEIMGHRRRPGAIMEVTFAGAKFIHIEHPTATDHTGEGPLSEMYSPAAVFSIVPCTMEEAVAAAKWAWPDPRETPGELVAAPIVADWDRVVDYYYAEDDPDDDGSGI